MIHNEITNNEFSIQLPRNALLPPEWSVLPLLRVNNRRPNAESYSVNLTNISSTNNNINNIINDSNSNISADTIPSSVNQNNDTTIQPGNINSVATNSENVKTSFSQPMYKVRLNKKSVAELRTLPNDTLKATGIITASIKPTKTIPIPSPTPTSVPHAPGSSTTTATAATAATAARAATSNSNKRKSYFDLIREEAENKKKIKQLEDEVNELRNWMNHERI
ncbi:unnamed protein product [[Candida] boidinii]|nr:unnamed protein product [[Candida] boidinii]